MAIKQPLIICEYCDSVYGIAPLSSDEKALCHCCGAVIQRGVSLTLQQRLALSVTAAVLLCFANFYPLMSIKMQGLHNAATLWDSVRALSDGVITFIALVAALAVILAPVVQTLLLLWVLAFALGRQRAPAFRLCMRWLEALRPWSMLEVCLLGALVAVVKLAGLLDVVPGIGLAALAALSVLMIKIAGKDIRVLWEVV
jgi:paraquat-inducible protein A